MSKTNSALQPQPKTNGLSKPAKIAIWVAVIILVAALAFGIVWTSIDHSYRYDLEDLSGFFKEGAVIDYEGLDALPITLETSVTRDAWLKKIYTNIKALDLDSKELYRYEADISKPNMPYPDIAYIYYEVFVDADKDGKADVDSTAGKPVAILSNTQYFDAAKAKEVRLGNGDLHTLIENHMRTYTEYGTKVERISDKDREIPVGYTRVVDLVITYETETTKDGETTTKENKYLTLTDFNLDLDAKPEGETYYTGTTTFEGMATDVKDHKIPKELSDRLIAELKKLDKVGSSAKFDKDSTEKITVTLPGEGNTATTLKVEAKVKSAFLAEMKNQTLNLSEQYIFDDGKNDMIKNDAPVEFEYKDSSGTTQKISKDKQLILNITVEKVVKLDRETVEALTEKDAAFKAPTKLGDNADAAYALEYMEHVKNTMQTEAIAKLKKDEATLTANVKHALWDAIVDRYATDEYITSFPEGEVEKYCDALMESYEAEYKNSGLTSKYANAQEYALVKIFEVTNAASMDAKEQAETLNKKLTEKAEEALRKEIILFWLADYFDVEITKADRKAAEREVYESFYNTYLQLYTSYYSSMYSKADIARLARQDAEAQSDALCTPAYLREYVALAEVQDSLVRDAKNYPNITWVLSGEAEHEH